LGPLFLAKVAALGDDASRQLLIEKEKRILAHKKGPAELRDRGFFRPALLLHRFDVSCLRAFFTLGEVVFDGLAFF
jgi:hypothetical protein